jgi:hypothetical protein
MGRIIIATSSNLASIKQIKRIVGSRPPYVIAERGKDARMILNELI